MHIGNETSAEPSAFSSEQFESEEKALFIRRSKLCIGVMGTPLVLAFSAVDYFYRPDLVVEFLKVRLWAIPVGLSCYLLYSARFFSDRAYRAPAQLFCLFLGFYNAYLVYLTGFEMSAYYAGLNLVALGSFFFLPWDARSVSINIVMIYAPYFLVLLLNRGSWNYSMLVPHVSFLGSAIFIGLISNHQFRTLRIEEAKSRYRLERENESKARIIEQKSKEAVKLSQLTRQFSPQIVEAILTGSVSVNEVVRREVTAIFVDTKGSTERSTRIDHSAFREILSDSLTNISKIFLKHNITVGGFVGDGMLAFSNAPELQHDHLERAMDACLEILDFCERYSDVYTEKWRKPFVLKIGINTGLTDVCFFPSHEIGSYTVIGPAVNEASRFCSHAEPNSISIPKSLVKRLGAKLAKDNLLVRRLEMKDSLKGLEGEMIELFSVGKKPQAKEQERAVCPLCAGALAVEADLGETLLVRCIEKCRYSDVVDKVSPNDRGKFLRLVFEK